MGNIYFSYASKVKSNTYMTTLEYLMSMWLIARSVNEVDGSFSNQLILCIFHTELLSVSFTTLISNPILIKQHHQLTILISV